VQEAAPAYDPAQQSGASPQYDTSQQPAQ
jgi:hypothetical protein